MSSYLREFTFEKSPKEITYLEEEPLKLTEEFTFFHNKSKLRKELSRLQYLIKSYTKNPLLALGIRDSFLKQEYTDQFLIMIFTTSEVVESTNSIIQEYLNLEITEGCFYLKTTPNYMLLLTRDLAGFHEGIDVVEEILKQILEDYFDKKDFQDFIKICPFTLKSCK
ncbi:MAG: hypothetical protein ACXAEX_06805 [Promethearchaeota archaeon]|jgi:hypothetical protein